MPAWVLETVGWLSTRSFPTRRPMVKPSLSTTIGSVLRSLRVIMYLLVAIFCRLSNTNGPRNKLPARYEPPGEPALTMSPVRVAPTTALMFDEDKSAHRFFEKLLPDPRLLTSHRDLLVKEVPLPISGLPEQRRPSGPGLRVSNIVAANIRSIEISAILFVRLTVAPAAIPED